MDRWSVASAGVVVLKTILKARPPYTSSGSAVAADSMSRVHACGREAPGAAAASRRRRGRDGSSAGSTPPRRGLRAVAARSARSRARPGPPPSAARAPCPCRRRTPWVRGGASSKGSPSKFLAASEAAEKRCSSRARTQAAQRCDAYAMAAGAVRAAAGSPRVESSGFLEACGNGPSECQKSHRTPRQRIRFSQEHETPRVDRWASDIFAFGGCLPHLLFTSPAFSNRAPRDDARAPARRDGLAPQPPPVRTPQRRSDDIEPPQRRSDDISMVDYSRWASIEASDSDSDPPPSRRSEPPRNPKEAAEFLDSLQRARRRRETTTQRAAPPRDADAAAGGRAARRPGNRRGSRAAGRPRRRLSRGRETLSRALARVGGKPLAAGRRDVRGQARPP